MTDDEYDTLRDWLRVKWIPGDPSGDDIVRYDDDLALSSVEQAAAIEGLPDGVAESWLELETARLLYRDPIDRESGITEAKVARYPERYRAISDAEDMLVDFADVDEQLSGQMTSWRRSSVLRMHALGIEPVWIAENLSLALSDVQSIIRGVSGDSA